MKLSDRERQEQRAAFQEMTPAKKLEYFWDYYKVHLLLVVTAIVILGSVLHHWATKKEPLLYAGYANVAVGDTLQAQLHEDFLSHAEIDPKEYEILFYRDLYLSNDPAAENHEIAYASRMKILATINARQLDLVLMNREAYDLLSASGYLLELTGLVDGIEPYLVENTVVLEDNSIELGLNLETEYTAVTEQSVNAIEVTGLSPFRAAGFPEPVYLGIIGNTPRLPDCIRYIEYLISFSS